MKAGIPVETPAYLVNQLCGSGLRAVALGYQGIKNGDASIVVAGGQESMSMAPARGPLTQRAEDGQPGIHRHHDQGRTDRRLPQHPHGHHGREMWRAKFQITREEQDRFAVASQNKAEAARKSGRFKRRDRAGDGDRAQRRQVIEQTNTSATAYLRLRVRTAAGLRQGRHGDGRQRIGLK
jgi:acetyl-CoA C-acetyltransferase